MKYCSFLVIVIVFQFDFCRTQNYSDDYADNSDYDSTTEFLESNIMKWVEEYKKENRHVWAKGKVKLPSGIVEKICIPYTGRSWHCKKKKKAKLVNTEYDLKEEYDVIKAALNTSGLTKGNVYKIQKIQNSCLWHKYNERKMKVLIETEGLSNDRLLFFDPGVNIWGYINAGFDERNVTENAFGKSFKFSSKIDSSEIKAAARETGNTNKKLLICRVNLGKIKKETDTVKRAHAPVGFHSVKGPNEDFYIYRGEQIYPEYLVTYND